MLDKLDAPGDIVSWISQNGLFDRLLVAQAQLEELTLVTSDPKILAYDVTTLDANA